MTTTGQHDDAQQPSAAPTRAVSGPRRSATRTLAALTASGVAAAFALTGASVPAGAAGGATLSPSSGPVGTTISVSGTCSDLLPEATTVRIVLSHTDAFHIPNAGPSYFHEATTTADSKGKFTGKIKVGPAVSYTTQGPGGNADAGPQVTRAPKNGDKIDVTALCYQRWTQNPLDVIEGTTQFTVAKGKIEVVKRPKAKGKAKAGKKLTARPGKWSPKPDAFTYQWKRGGKSIKKATKKRYQLKKKDVGKKISVVVKATRDGYRPGKARSPKRTVR